MTTARFHFASGNLGKLLAIPKYVLSFVFSWFVPRSQLQWAFGSGIGVGEGALPVALYVRQTQPGAVIFWMVGNESERALAERHDFIAVQRNSWRGFWITLRSGTLVVTHGLGDVNRFGVFGAVIIQLWHGAPMKRIHLDSPVTTKVTGPRLIRALLRRMYEHGSQQVSLYVAGSIEAAERLRSAFRVDPGKVRVLGDPRDDVLVRQAQDPVLANEARATVLEEIGLTDIGPDTPIFMYAPTWRDGDDDPAIPDAAEIESIHSLLKSLGAHLIIRSHPLGAGDYEPVLSERVHMFRSDRVRDINPLLGAFDALITDYSSIAIDFALLERPIVWFAPDLESYSLGRGLYEPLEITAAGAVEGSWGGVIRRLGRLVEQGSQELREAQRNSRALAERFHAFRDGASAARVLEYVAELKRPARELVPNTAVFFESFYGRQVSCNPLALDREIAARYPDLDRYWSVTSERQTVPEGATPVLVGGKEWFAARRHAKLLIVNDWLRYRFKRSRSQFVLQTWHGTMLKHLALDRPKLSLRTRIAIRRESRRWSAMLSQNPHATEQFRKSYAFSGPVFEEGYPRVDRLALANTGSGLNPVTVRAARAAVGVPLEKRVLVYAPTWRERALTAVDELDVNALAAELGEEWVVVARGHTRQHSLGGYNSSGEQRVIDASKHPDINNVILAADLIVTDYSSLMFDAAATNVPIIFFVPDLENYRDRERGFTFDFEDNAPGPLLTRREEVASCADALARDGRAAKWIGEYQSTYEAWQERFLPHDDGFAASRVVDKLEECGALTPAIAATSNAALTPNS